VEKSNRDHILSRLETICATTDQSASKIAPATQTQQQERVVMPEAGEPMEHGVAPPKAVFVLAALQQRNVYLRAFDHLLRSEPHELRLSTSVENGSECNEG
jgi:hypothetical protein